MNTADMKAALDAFKRGKEILSWDGNYYGNYRYICHCLLGRGATAAKQIVMQSLDQWFTYRGWLAQHDERVDDYTDDEIQAGRHAFVDACIAELERRIAGAKP